MDEICRGPSQAPRDFSVGARSNTISTKGLLSERTGVHLPAKWRCFIGSRETLPIFPGRIVSRETPFGFRQAAIETRI